MVIIDSTVKPQYKKEQFDVQDEILTKLILTLNQRSCNHIQHHETIYCVQTTIHNSNYTHDSKSPVYKVISLISTIFSQNGTIINEENLFVICLWRTCYTRMWKVMEILSWRRCTALKVNRVECRTISEEIE